MLEAQRHDGQARYICLAQDFKVGAGLKALGGAFNEIFFAPFNLFNAHFLLQFEHQSCANGFNNSGRAAFS